MQAAVAGIVDEAVLRRLVGELHVGLGPVHGKGGKHHLLHRLQGFNQAAKFGPWVVLIDLDADADCAPVALAAWLRQPAARRCCRVAVRAIEAWLIADRPGIARFLAVAESRVPAHPDAVANPKQAVVQMAAASRRRDIREELVPRQGSGRFEGPAYASRLVEFAADHWAPAVAIESSDSLRRCWDNLTELAVVEML